MVADADVALEKSRAKYEHASEEWEKAVLKRQFEERNGSSPGLKKSISTKSLKNPIANLSLQNLHDRFAQGLKVMALLLTYHPFLKTI